MAYLSGILGNRKGPSAIRGGYYTNYYTSALRKRFFHSCHGAILHVRQNMRVAMRSAPACDALRGASTKCSVVLGGLRAVLGHCAGRGLPLPQAKSPYTVARIVINFEPEPHRQGSDSLALVGVGRRNGRSHCWACIPPRKYAPTFKDTSIHRLAS